MSFAEFVRSLGLLPGTIAADGKWRRCPTENHPRKKNGSYKLTADGRFGWVQDWAVHLEPVEWRANGADPSPSFDPTAHRKATEAHTAALKVRRLATLEAREFYASCRFLRGGHAYLESHGLDMTGCIGLRVDRDGWLVVPVLRDRYLMSVQRISPTGEKRFWPGASVKGAAYRIERKDASVSVLCEGLATGLAIYAAVPLCRVVVAFYASNLANLELPRPGMALVAADNDSGTEARLGSNPGLLAAQRAAEGLGCGFIGSDGIEGTDWADWRAERLAERKARGRPYESLARAQKIVDAELSRKLLAVATFLRPRE